MRSNTKQNNEQSNTIESESTNRSDVSKNEQGNSRISSVEFKRVFVEVNGFAILKDISVALQEKRVAIIGNNGSGKSTFARCATGVQTITKKEKILSEIVIHGQPLTRLKQVWKHINMTFQIPDQQIIMPSVEEELMVGIKHCDFDDHKVQEKLNYALNILQIKGSQPCHSLSAGQKRMLSLLSILLIEPHTIIIDEPTTFLDIPTKTYIMDFLSQLEEQLIIITHDLHLIESFERVLCFHKGEIIHDGNYRDTVKLYKTLW